MGQTHLMTSLPVKNTFIDFGKCSDLLEDSNKIMKRCVSWPGCFESIKKGLTLTTFCLATAAALVAWCSRHTCFVSGQEIVTGLSRPFRNRLPHQSPRLGAVRRRAIETVVLGQRLQGVVKACNSVGALIDVGLKRPAFMHVAEISEEYVGSADEALSNGQQIEVCVVEENPKEITVSMKRCHLKGALDFHVGQEVEGTVVHVTPKNIFVDIGAVVDALLYQDFAEDFSKGQRIKAQIRQVSSKGIKLTMSGRGLRSLSDYQLGDVVNGTVVKVNARFAFVDIGGIREASLHEHEVEGEGPLWTRLREGQSVTARIISIDPRGMQLSLTGFERRSNSDFQVGDMMEGKVTGLNERGAFVDIGALRYALLEDSWGLKWGQTLKVMVVRTDSERVELKRPLIESL